MLQADAASNPISWFSVFNFIKSIKRAGDVIFSYASVCQKLSECGIILLSYCTNKRVQFSCPTVQLPSVSAWLDLDERFHLYLNGWLISQQLQTRMRRSRVIIHLCIVPVHSTLSGCMCQGKLTVWPLPWHLGTYTAIQHRFNGNAVIAERFDEMAG